MLSGGYEIGTMTRNEYESQTLLDGVGMQQQLQIIKYEAPQVAVMMSPSDFLTLQYFSNYVKPMVQVSSFIFGSGILKSFAYEGFDQKSGENTCLPITAKYKFGMGVSNECLLVFSVF